MQELIINKEIVSSFIGTIIALISAGFVWFIKSAYEKHRAEVLSLAKIERTFAFNLRIIEDNFEFIDKWIFSLDQDRPFSYHFGKYISNEEETYKLSNLDLIKEILTLNYMLERTSLDFDNIYKNYWDTILKIDSIQDEERKLNNLRSYHVNVQATLREIRKNYEPLKGSLIRVIAKTRAAFDVRFHSLFGYISLLFRDIFPRINEKSVKRHVVILEKNIERNEKV